MPSNCELPSLDQVITYVQGKGWKKQSAAACCKVSVYSNDQAVSLTLPTSDKFIDYEFKLRNALDTLSTVEGLSPSDLVETIKCATGA